MTFKLHDTVKTKQALPGARSDGGDVPAGAEGVIVFVHEKPREAFEVEFCDESGRTLAQSVVDGSQLLLA